VSCDNISNLITTFITSTANEEYEDCDDDGDEVTNMQGNEIKNTPSNEFSMNSNEFFIPFLHLPNADACFLLELCQSSHTMIQHVVSSLQSSSDIGLHYDQILQTMNTLKVFDSVIELCITVMNVLSLSSYEITIISLLQSKPTLLNHWNNLSQNTTVDSSCQFGIYLIQIFLYYSKTLLDIFERLDKLIAVHGSIPSNQEQTEAVIETTMDNDCKFDLDDNEENRFEILKRFKQEAKILLEHSYECLGTLLRCSPITFLQHINIQSQNSGPIYGIMNDLCLHICRGISYDDMINSMDITLIAINACSHLPRKDMEVEMTDKRTQTILSSKLNALYTNCFLRKMELLHSFITPIITDITSVVSMGTIHRSKVTVVKGMILVMDGCFNAIIDFHSSDDREYMNNFIKLNVMMKMIMYLNTFDQSIPILQSFLHSNATNHEFERLQFTKVEKKKLKETSSTMKSFLQYKNDFQRS
jgi:hypothetical protein